MGNPFAMSFDEIKAQADANMKADKGQAATPVETQTNQKQPETKPASERSFLDIVNETQRRLAQENSEAAEKETPKTEPAETPKTEPAASASTISFDDVAQKTTETAKAAPTFEDLMSQTPGATNTAASFDAMFENAKDNKESQPTNGTGISFDDLAAQAGAQTPGDVSFDTVVSQMQANEQAKEPEKGFMNEPVKDPVQETKQENAPVQEQTNTESAGTGISFDNLAAQANTEAPAGAGISFDDMIAQAQANMAEEESKTHTQPETQPKAEEPKAETQSKAEVPKTEEPETQSKAEEPKAEAPETQPDAEKSKTEQPKVEEPKAETQAKPRKSRSKKKEEEKKEPLPDTTEEYKVDLGQGTAKEQPEETETEQLSMNNLFTPEEIKAIRTDIQTFVRKEFKKAMVGVMKELLTEFNE